MSEIHLRQIKAYLQKTFNGLIDVSDYQNKSRFTSSGVSSLKLLLLA